MSITDTTAPSQSDALSLEFDLKHSPEKIWRALTEPTLMAQWLLPVMDLTLERGAAFKLQAPAFPGWDGIVDCKFIEIEPLKKLSYHWNVGGMELMTVVTFTLTRTETGTRMTVVQSGFKPEQKQNFGGARYGWKMMGGKLVDLLDQL